MVLYGLFHGLLYLPVMLSWIGPDSYYSDDDDDEEVGGRPPLPPNNSIPMKNGYDNRMMSPPEPHLNGGVNQVRQGRVVLNVGICWYRVATGGWYTVGNGAAGFSRGVGFPRRV